MSGKLGEWNHFPIGCEINTMAFDIQLSLFLIVQMFMHMNACKWITHRFHVREIK